MRYLQLVEITITATLMIFVGLRIYDLSNRDPQTETTGVDQRVEREIREAQKGDLIVFEDSKGVVMNILLVMVPAGTKGYDLRAQPLAPMTHIAGYPVENLVRQRTGVVSARVTKNRPDKASNTFLYGEVLAEYFSRY